jgi:hypothetical protein
MRKNQRFFRARYRFRLQSLYFCANKLHSGGEYCKSVEKQNRQNNRDNKDGF